MTRKILSLLLFSLMIGWSPSGGPLAQALPMKPEYNYSIWMNINEAVLEMAELVANDPAWLVMLREMPTRKFSKKVPREVLIALIAFSQKVDEARQNASLVETVLYVDDVYVSPGVVYRLSGRVLSSLAEHLVCIGGKDQQIAKFFERRRFHDLTSSDVFQAIDLALRRLILVVKKYTETASGRRGCRE